MYIIAEDIPKKVTQKSKNCSICRVPTCRLLTGAKTYEEMLRLTDQGDSSKIDMLVGDIYGGSDYEAVGLSADTIASSFGKIAAQPQELEDYNPAGATHPQTLLSGGFPKTMEK